MSRPRSARAPRRAGSYRRAAVGVARPSWSAWRPSWRGAAARSYARRRQSAPNSDISDQSGGRRGSSRTAARCAPIQSPAGAPRLPRIDGTGHPCPRAAAIGPWAGVGRAARADGRAPVPYIHARRFESAVDDIGYVGWRGRSHEKGVSIGFGNRSKNWIVRSIWKCDLARPRFWF